MGKCSKRKYGLRPSYDAIYCSGSLINASLDVTRLEVQELLKHLPVGGRWLELAYPRARWEREGRMSFDRWGENADGGAPWIEWHDIEKVKWYLAPAQFEVVLEFEYHNSDFNWFDLVRTSNSEQHSAVQRVVSRHLRRPATGYGGSSERRAVMSLHSLVIGNQRRIFINIAVCGFRRTRDTAERPT